MWTSASDHPYAYPGKDTKLPTDDAPLPPGLRVLLVEDEPLIAMDGEATLQSMGVSEVVCIRALSDGLNALDSQPFHAALLDLQLGEESSIPLALRLQALGVPFGFLTGFQNDAIPEELRHCPVLAKPYRAEDLGKLLYTLLGRP
jgi:DNA-binding LytR/AlgR family response regulator